MERLRHFEKTESKKDDLKIEAFDKVKERQEKLKKSEIVIPQSKEQRDKIKNQILKTPDKLDSSKRSNMKIEKIDAKEKLKPKEQSEGKMESKNTEKGDEKKGKNVFQKMADIFHKKEKTENKTEKKPEAPDRGEKTKEEGKTDREKVLEKYRATPEQLKAMDKIMEDYAKKPEKKASGSNSDGEYIEPRERER